MSRFVEIALFADDVEGVTRFYEHVLGATPESRWPGGAVFSAAGLKLLVHERAATMPDGPPNEDHVAIGVTDLTSKWTSLLEAGYTGLVGPRDYPWGRSAYLRDPDGRLLELTGD